MGRRLLLVAATCLMLSCGKKDPSVSDPSPPYPFTPLPRSATNGDYRQWSPPDVSFPNWAVDDIGKPNVPHLSARQQAVARWAYRVTPSCMRWALRFAWIPIGEGGSTKGFAFYRDGGRKSYGSPVIYFTKNEAIAEPVPGDAFLIAVNSPADYVPKVRGTCDPLGRN